MSYDRGNGARRYGIPVQPRRSGEPRDDPAPALEPPSAATPRRRGQGAGERGWSPGSVSRPVLIVAILVVLLLAGVAVLSQRGLAPPPAAGGQSTRSQPAAPEPTAAQPTIAPGSAARQPAAQPTAPALATAPAARRVFIVANTDGAGAYLRRTPDLADLDTAYEDGTRLEQVGDDVTVDGRTWRRVRAPDGRIGWMPAEYTAEPR